MPATWIGLSGTVQGAVHARDGKPNQDSVCLHQPGGGAGALLLAVADGHGSTRSFRSDRGAALATKCALRLLQVFLRRNGPRAPLSSLRRQLETSWPSALVRAWRQAVREDLAERPFTALEFAAFPERPPVVMPGEELPFNAYLAYGATLIAAAVTRRYILFAQIGDGDILTVAGDGSVTRPWPPEHTFYANETVSLCSHQAARQVRSKVELLRAKPPALVLISTDGYANCFGSDEAFFRVGTDFLAYLREGGLVFVKQHLQPWLQDSSRDGSGDDITVGLAVRLSALRGRPAN